MRGIKSSNFTILKTISVLGLFFLSACLSNGSSSSRAKLRAKNTLASVLLASRGPVSIKTAVRTPNNPQTSLDIVGIDDNAIGKYCGTLNQSLCRCVFDFIGTNQTPQRIEIQPYYLEDNMLRCNISQIPTIIEYMTIRLAVTDSTTQSVKVSNDVILYLNGYGIGSDLSTPSEFAAIHRYQCRDAIVVPYAFDPNVYDPIASEDPKYSYPLNYYTSNYGRSLSSFVSNSAAHAQNGAGWICPTNPNLSDPRHDLRVFSEAPLNGNSVIAHSLSQAKPSGSFDRSSFYLSRRPSGVFTVPVHAYTAPNTNTVNNPGLSQSGPIGYGAAPIPIGSGTGQETCPAYTIPGYRWVKLWQFRASLDSRQIPLMQAGVVSRLGKMVCTPNGNYSTGTSTPYPASTGAQNLLCNRSTGCIYISGQIYSILPLGFMDQNWQAQSSSAFLNVPPNAPLTQSSFENDDQYTLASPDAGISRYDFLLTVSPAQQLNPNEVVVHTSDFRNGPNLTAQQYTPYRFLSTLDCPIQDANGIITDPKSTNNAQCQAALQANRLITYGFRSTNINVPGNAGTGGGGLPDFPVCALQKL